MLSSKWLWSRSIEPVTGFIVRAKFDTAIANRIVALPVDIAFTIPLFPEHGFPIGSKAGIDRLTKFAQPRFMLGSIGCGLFDRMSFPIDLAASLRIHDICDLWVLNVSFSLRRRCANGLRRA
jgi:hypothetical protein